MTAITCTTTQQVKSDICAQIIRLRSVILSGALLLGTNLAAADTVTRAIGSIHGRVVSLGADSVFLDRGCTGDLREYRWGEIESVRFNDACETPENERSPIVPYIGDFTICEERREAFRVDFGGESLLADWVYVQGGVVAVRSLSEGAPIHGPRAGVSYIRRAMVCLDQDFESPAALPGSFVRARGVLSEMYVCRQDDLYRRVAVIDLPESDAACRVTYYKDSEAPLEVDELWSATQEAGFCTAQAARFAEVQLADWGWSCGKRL